MSSSADKRFRLSLDIDQKTHARLNRLVHRMNAASVTEVIRRISEDAEDRYIMKEAIRLTVEKEENNER